MLSIRRLIRLGSAWGTPRDWSRTRRNRGEPSCRGQWLVLVGRSNPELNRQRPS